MNCNQKSQMTPVVQNVFVPRCALCAPNPADHPVTGREAAVTMRRERFPSASLIPARAFVRSLRDDGLRLGVHDFYAWLRREGYLCRVEGVNQVSVKADLMGILVRNTNGDIRTGHGICVTPVGVMYLRDRLTGLCRSMDLVAPAQAVRP